jgi:hypothetical protein
LIDLAKDFDAMTGDDGDICDGRQAEEQTLTVNHYLHDRRRTTGFEVHTPQWLR